jgi:hypothetical protein
MYPNCECQNEGEVKRGIGQKIDPSVREKSINIELNLLEREITRLTENSKGLIQSLSPVLRSVPSKECVDGQGAEINYCEFSELIKRHRLQIISVNSILEEIGQRLEI